MHILKDNPRPPVLFRSVVVPLVMSTSSEVNPAPPWNVGPNVLSTSLSSPGLSVVMPMGLSVAVGVGELVRSPYAAMVCLPSYLQKYSLHHTIQKQFYHHLVLDERLVLWLGQV